MRELPYRRAGGSLLVALVAAACGSGGASGMPSAGPPPAASPDEIEAIYQARLESARGRYTEADVSFMTRMIGHHAQALDMARLAVSNAASSQVQVLAARIINAQMDEIATMQRWLRDRGQPVPDVDTPTTANMPHEPDHAMHMPGMITAEQMRVLEQARGAEFDRVLLSFMIQHHAGAVRMVEELFSTDGAAQDEEAFKLASDALADQSAEIDRMEAMLANLSARGPTP
jgi:uncharacterized protein (DUF305 family)